MKGAILSKGAGGEKMRNIALLGFQGIRILINRFRGLNLALSASFIEGYRWAACRGLK